MRRLAPRPARCLHFKPHNRLPKLFPPLRLFTTTAALSFSHHEPLQYPRSRLNTFPSTKDESSYLSLVLRQRETIKALQEKKAARRERQGPFKGERERHRKRLVYFEEQKEKRKEAAVLEKKENRDRLLTLPVRTKEFAEKRRAFSAKTNALGRVKYRASKPSTFVVPFIPQSVLSYHYETTPPSPIQLRAARHFFYNNPSKPLFSTTRFFTQPLTGIPEVCFLGRSNVGKSSLLNCLVDQNHMCNVSAQPGRTRSMAGYVIGGKQSDGKEGKLVLMDMPGYGKGSRPEWGREIGRYLASRKELRRVFVVIDAEVGLKKNDIEMLALLRHQGISHQVILGKVDRVLMMEPNKKGSRKKVPLGSLEAHLRIAAEHLAKKADMIMATAQPKGEVGPGALGEILCIASGDPQQERHSLGIHALRWAILQATGLNWSGDVERLERTWEKRATINKERRSAKMRGDDYDDVGVIRESDEGDEERSDGSGGSSSKYRHRVTRGQRLEPNTRRETQKPALTHKAKKERKGARGEAQKPATTYHAKLEGNVGRRESNKTKKAQKPAPTYRTKKERKVRTRNSRSYPTGPVHTRPLMA